MRGRKRVFERLYRTARRPQDLPWHRDEPPALLVAALDARPRAGAALDVGCGAGTHALYMAGRGYRVTAVDFMAEAVAMLTRRVAGRGLAITATQADVLLWQPPHVFDVVLDVGCLHGMDRAGHAAYRECLLRWLAPAGDFILVHCERRGWWDRWPAGPSRMPRDAILGLFGPELTLRAHRPVDLRGLPLLMGGTARAGAYWFTRVG
jgi:SAM-dependent methyltransferase